ncbi:MAG: MptD family putative ECF transporter S component [Clostridia bacterium]
MTNRLTVKDLINVGVFTALYIVIFFVSSFIGYVPVFMVLLPVICAVVVGIPFMLFLSKTHTFGMVTIMSMILWTLCNPSGTPFGRYC